MEKALLLCENICYSYHTPNGEIPVIHNLSFQVKEGEFLSIVGPSGCGKSTLLNILTKLTKPESGTVQYNYTQDEIKQKHPPCFGYMPQQDQLFEWYTIEKNCLLPLQINHCLTTQSKQYVHSLLKRYGLFDFISKKPSELSGGMRQRAALIRTLAMKPSLLLLDEPFSALDYQNRLKVADDIRQIIRKEKKTAVLVTHDIAEAISLSHRIFVLSQKPTTLKKEITLQYQEKQLNAFQIREEPDFHSYFDEIWKELNQ